MSATTQQGNKTRSSKKSIIMNEDLKDWISAEEQAAITKTLDTHHKEKKPKGKCTICRIRHAKFVCVKCGNSVCSSCFITLVGLCQECLSQETLDQWKHKKTDWNEIVTTE